MSTITENRKVLYCTSGRFNLSEDFLSQFYRLYPTIDVHKLKRTDKRLVQTIQEVGFDKSACDCVLKIIEIQAGYFFKIQKQHNGEVILIRLDYDSIIHDLVNLYITGSQDFKSPLTKDVLDGEVVF